MAEASGPTDLHSSILSCTPEDAEGKGGQWQKVLSSFSLQELLALSLPLSNITAEPGELSGMARAAQLQAGQVTRQRNLLPPSGL